MRGRFFRALLGAALFLAGYGMQQGGIEPFAGIGDPRLLGLLLEILGLVLLLSPILARRRLPEPRPPRIRRELVRKPADSDTGKDRDADAGAPAASGQDGPPGPDESGPR